MWLRALDRAGFAVAGVLLSALAALRPCTGRVAAFSVVFGSGSLAALLASLAYGATGAGVTVFVGGCLAVMYGVVWVCGFRLPPIGRAIAALYLLEGARDTILALAGLDPLPRAGNAIAGFLLFGALYILAGPGSGPRRRVPRALPRWLRGRWARFAPASTPA